MEKVTKYYKVRVFDIRKFVLFLKKLLPLVDKGTVFSAGIGVEYFSMTGNYDKNAAMHPETSSEDFHDIMTDFGNSKNFGIGVTQLSSKPHPETNWKGKWVAIQERINHIENSLKDDDEEETETTFEVINHFIPSDLAKQAKEEQKDHGKVLNDLAKGEISVEEATKEIAEKEISNKKQPNTLNKEFLENIKVNGQDIAVYLVNGTYIRDNIPQNKLAFTMGGTRYVGKEYEFIEPDTIYIDNVYKDNNEEVQAILVHEAVEMYHIRYDKKTYENAHYDFANPAEKRFREQYKKDNSLTAEKFLKSELKQAEGKKWDIELQDGTKLSDYNLKTIEFYDDNVADVELFNRKTSQISNISLNREQYVNLSENSRPPIKIAVIIDNTDIRKNQAIFRRIEYLATHSGKKVVYNIIDNKFDAKVYPFLLVDKETNESAGFAEVEEFKTKLQTPRKEFRKKLKEQISELKQSETTQPKTEPFEGYNILKQHQTAERVSFQVDFDFNYTPATIDKITVFKEFNNNYSHSWNTEKTYGYLKFKGFKEIGNKKYLYVSKVEVYDQKQGHATKLYQYAIEQAKEMGFAGLYSESVVNPFIYKIAEKLNANIDRAKNVIVWGEETNLNGKEMEKNQEYTYALTIRPFSIGTYPKDNFVKFIDDVKYPFGLLVYSQPVSIEQVQHFNLSPISEIEKYDNKKIIYYEDFVATVSVKRNSKNLPFVEVTMFDKNNEEVDKESLTADNFLQNIYNGRYKVVEDNQKANEIAETPEQKAIKLFGESTVKRLLLNGYKIMYGKFDNEAHAHFFGLHTGVNADEWERSGLKIVKPQAIKTDRTNIKKIVDDINTGVTINDIYNEWDNIKTDTDHIKWSERVFKTDFGFHSIFDLLNDFHAKFPNEIIKNSFYMELEKALKLPFEKMVYTRANMQKKSRELDKQDQIKISQLENKISIKSTEYNKLKLKELIKTCNQNKTTIVAEVEDSDEQYYLSLGFKTIG